MSRPIAISFSFGHHGQFSSFHRLLHYLGKDVEKIDHTLRLPRLIPPAIRNRIDNRWLHLAETRLRWRLKGTTGRTIHFFYPENCLHYAREWKKHHRLVLSCHQPSSELPGLKKFSSYSGFFEGLAVADSVVVLDESEVEGYQPYVHNGNILSIPHGVDTEYFTPGPSPANDETQSPRTILTVGNWLRDYKKWAEVREAVHRRDPYVHFRVIANSETLAQANLQKQPPNVEFCSGLSDPQLRDAYRDADLLLLPLKDAVANNALLEGMAMGLPILVSDLPATRNYALDSAMFFRNCSNAEDIADQIFAVLCNPTLTRHLRESARARALGALSWTDVATHYSRLYEMRSIA